ncbi:PVC-type heme-binding CxxCH protein [Pedobacter nyackensis]|uniref:PVC-type heme-binding CxxCH protein n=1 Tax=Pedobacter nyackensis TaxID=475255 RepID=UPI002930649A|nr:PVC-type heme-binding CxxCH protein [Pedobacter nyackensis]
MIRKLQPHTKTIFRGFLFVFSLGLILFFTIQGTLPNANTIKIKKGSRIVLIGNNLASRMMNFGHFETEMHLRYPDSLLFIRNMADGGNTPGFRPHPSRNSPWAFPGAEKFQTELATNSGSEGHFPTEDEWLVMLKPDVILAFFGYSESFQGAEGLENYKAELDAFIKHTLSQKYNGVAVPELAIVSPIAFEDLSDKRDLPNGKKENVNLELYAKAMEEIALKNKVLFIDAFTPTSKWFQSKSEDFTIDGSQLNDEGYAKFSVMLADKVFGNKSAKDESNRELVRKAVLEKNWMWHNDIKIPNGVHAYGRRYDPFGPKNYPAEVAKIREMTAIRDQAIWQAAKGKQMDVAGADARTSVLPEVETNYKPSGKNGNAEYLYGKDALDKFHLAPGYKIELFASEVEFPDLAKPVQMTFDTKGRLWVSTMPTYPHWKPGDPKPNDKILIFEDTNNDGKADKQKVFADGLHLPIGFSFAPEGVYVSQGTNLILLTDTDGDDKADVKKIIMSGFDDHDTHHAHSTYTMDPSGAIYMGEGVFLHSNVETSYGPVRATNGGFFRYAPQRNHLERVAQLSIPNPWGIAFDDWGQTIYAETSGPSVRWMLPGTIKPRYGETVNKGLDLVEEKHKVRPTSGLEFVSSRHFPNEVQGDYLINNTIGFLGAKQHMLIDDGTGFKGKHRQDLFWSDDKNFRPVDLEFAPDGSLYLIDWHNVLIGHMQHNARDPLRDHLHGRVYRITYPSRPLVKPAKIAGASIDVLLNNLKLPEYGSRYRTHIELRGRKASDVLPRIKTWVAKLDKKDPKYEHHVLEALWVTWGLNKLDQNLLKMMLNAKDYRARAAAVQVVRYMGHQLPDQSDLLLKAAKDVHGRVRLEAITAASWLDKAKGLPIVMEAGKKDLDEWIAPAYEAAVAHLNGVSVKAVKQVVQSQTALKGNEQDQYVKGKAIFMREGFCVTCHQEDGKGLGLAGFPPLAKTMWVEGSIDRLIKLTLKGLHGPIEVLGKKYPGQVPMTPFGGMLNDDEVAAVLTYVRNSFGNNASAVSPAKVKEIRASIAGKDDFYTPEALLKAYPMEKK